MRGASWWQSVALVNLSWENTVLEESNFSALCPCWQMTTKAPQALALVLPIYFSKWANSQIQKLKLSIFEYFKISKKIESINPTNPRPKLTTCQDLATFLLLMTFSSVLFIAEMLLGLNSKYHLISLLCKKTKTKWNNQPFYFIIAMPQSHLSKLAFFWIIQYRLSNISVVYKRTNYTVMFIAAAFTIGRR